jgi:hypothetical protein
MSRENYSPEQFGDMPRKMDVRSWLIPDSIAVTIKTTTFIR